MASAYKIDTAPPRECGMPHRQFRSVSLAATRRPSARSGASEFIVFGKMMHLNKVHPHPYNNITETPLCPLIPLNPSRVSLHTPFFLYLPSPTFEGSRQTMPFPRPFYSPASQNHSATQTPSRINTGQRYDPAPGRPSAFDPLTTPISLAFL